ncbi:uncharacterized protein LOC118479484 [Helianthus annuus]|uniref:uncharacterized protein LOC118479484 n=1 Tax=Helianthus annuus TaxID=4232 RepID=UPI00165338C9|nr:uncharacterized protein LOC118479484 [Helianthus annuus]
MDPDPVVEPGGAFHIRGEDEDFDDNLLDLYPELFSIVLNHGGYFTNYPGRDYVNGKQSNIDLLTVERFSNHELQLIRRELGYEDEIPTFFHFRKLGSIDLGIQELLHFVKNNIRIIDVYLEHGNTNIHPFPGTQSSVVINSDQSGQEDEDSDGDEVIDQSG